jgi:hypothetical protein
MWWARLLNNIAGVIAFQGLAAGDYEPIETVTLTGSQATITFSSIPSTYKHLQIRAIGRMAAAATLDSLWAQFNSDTTSSNYYAHGIYATGSGTPGAYADSGAFAQIGILSANSAGANMFGAFVMDILDYSNTNKYKTTRTLSGADLNGDGQLRFVSGLWKNTAAISSIVIDGNSNFAQYSSFALYGIKG